MSIADVKMKEMENLVLLQFKLCLLMRIPPSDVEIKEKMAGQADGRELLETDIVFLIVF